MLKFPEAKFLTSAWQPGQFPDDIGAEVAFAGRSNSGKSSALNAITGRANLARTSKTPGRTQLINFFELAPAGMLVDLPGYGYAKVPGKMRAHWRELLNGYLERRRSLAAVVVVMDARRPLLEFDRQMLGWAQSQRMPVHLLLTKSDQLSKSEALRTLQRVRAETGDYASAQLFSAVTKAGLDEARDAVLALLERRWAPAAPSAQKEPRWLGEPPGQ